MNLKRRILVDLGQSKTKSCPPMSPLIISKRALRRGPHAKNVQNKFCFIEGTQMQKVRFPYIF